MHGSIKASVSARACIASPELTTVQYEGTEFPLPSEAKIEAHATSRLWWNRPGRTMAVQNPVFSDFPYTFALWDFASFSRLPRGGRLVLITKQGSFPFRRQHKRPRAQPGGLRLFLPTHFHFHQTFHFFPFGLSTWLLVISGYLITDIWKWDVLGRWGVSKSFKQNHIQIYLFLPFSFKKITENFHTFI